MAPLLLLVGVVFVVAWVVPVILCVRRRRALAFGLRLVMAGVVAAAVVAGVATYEPHDGPPDEEHPSRDARVTYFLLGGLFLADALALAGLGFAFSTFGPGNGSDDVNPAS